MPLTRPEPFDSVSDANRGELTDGREHVGDLGRDASRRAIGQLGIRVSFEHLAGHVLQRSLT